MKIVNINYGHETDRSEVCVVIRGEPNHGISYARFMQLAEELPKFLSWLDKNSPHKKLTAADAQASLHPETADQVVLPPVGLASDTPAAPVEPSKQVTVDEVIARKKGERKSKLTVSGVMEIAVDPDKIAAAVVAQELPATPSSTIATVVVAPEPPPIVSAPIEAAMAMDEISQVVAEVEDSSFGDDEPQVPETSPEEALWARYGAALETLHKAPRAGVLDAACAIWKSFKDEIKSFGEQYAGKASNSMTFKVHEVLGIPEAEAFHLIKATLRGEKPTIPAPQKPRMVSPSVPAPVAPAPVVTPAAVAAPVSTELQQNFMAKYEKQAVKDLKNALIVAATFATVERDGKLYVPKKKLTSVLAELHGCVPALNDPTAVTAALDSSQMPIFCALQARGTWDKTN